MLLCCTFCGRSVNLRPSRKKRFKFCSRQCLEKATRSVREPARLAVIKGKKPYNWSGMQKACQMCGKLFYISPSRQHTKKYCSQICYGIAQRVEPPYRPCKKITVNGRRVPKHRHVMEQALGRKLLPSEHVHHKNRNTHDNRRVNLELLDIHEHGRISSKHRGVPR